MDGVPYELVSPTVVPGTPPAQDVRGEHGIREVDDPVSGERVLFGTGGGRVMVSAALRASATGVPWVGVPTSYSPACVGVRPAPLRVVADPDLPASLPARERLLSLAAARAVAMEALWAPDSTPSVRWVAVSALRTLHPLVAAGGAVVEPGTDAAARAQRAALLAGIGSANCAPGLLSVLARRLDDHGVPWAVAMCSLLPRVARWQGTAASDAVATLADVAGTASRDAAISSLDVVGVPALQPRLVDLVVEEVLAGAHSSPRPAGPDDLRMLLAG